MSAALRTRKTVTTVVALTATLALAACSPEATVISSSAQSGSGGSGAPGTSGASKPPVDQLSPTGADLSAYTTQSLTWSRADCSADMSKVTRYSSRTQCARVKAPKDYGDPSKGDITLMVARTQTSQPGARAMFTNPGGPGAPAGAFSAIVATITDAGQQHDVYGVDPRGTGDSTPVSCRYYTSDATDQRDRSGSNVDAEETAAKKTVDECWAKYPDYLPYITTDNTARDQDLVRQLVGADTIDYYGVSAGTWLGARYANLFPGHVGRFVLDSNTDFVSNFSVTADAQAQAFQKRFDEQFVPWAARHDSAYGLGTDSQSVKANVEKVRAAAKDGRLGSFTPDDIDGMSAQLLYADRSFVSLATLLGLLLQATNGDTGALSKAESLAGGSSSSGGSSTEATVFMTTLCNDTPWTKDPAKVSEAESQAGEKYPLVGYHNPGMECAYWPKTAPQTTVDLKGSPNILMLQTEYDPATPYPTAFAAHRATPNTRLLSVDNQGNHGAYAGGGNPCVEKVVEDFLDDGNLIGQDSVCPAIALPKDDRVYPVGATPEGQMLPMPAPKPKSAKDILLALLQELLDQILQPKH